jgi:hypothetical protein
LCCMYAANAMPTVLTTGRSRSQGYTQGAGIHLLAPVRPPRAGKQAWAGSMATCSLGGGASGGLVRMGKGLTCGQSNSLARPRCRSRLWRWSGPGWCTPFCPGQQGVAAVREAKRVEGGGESLKDPPAVGFKLRRHTDDAGDGTPAPDLGDHGGAILLRAVALDDTELVDVVLRELFWPGGAPMG